jgi:hypothetical protein
MPRLRFSPESFDCLKKRENGGRIQIERLQAVTVKSVASGRDAETGDRLLWVETNDSGVFAFRLNREATEMMADALRDDRGLDAVAVTPD